MELVEGGVGWCKRGLDLEEVVAVNFFGGLVWYFVVPI